ncbi:MAG TPA: hypothetical protein VGM68_04580 [Rhizomicrobium sp.]|jgi:hypothetical protein
MKEFSTAEQTKDAILKLMRLANTALHAGRIEEASRLLRLAAIASENETVMRQIGAAPDETLTQIVVAQTPPES